MANPTIPARIAAAREQLQRKAWMIQPTALHFVLDMLDEAERTCSTPEVYAALKDRAERNLTGAREASAACALHRAALRTLARIEQLLEETK